MPRPVALALALGSSPRAALWGWKLGSLHHDDAGMLGLVFGLDMDGDLHILHRFA